MVNQSGNNGSGRKKYPPDEVLKESLLRYSRLGLSQHQKLQRLGDDHQLDIKTTKLNELERKFKIPSVKRPYLSKETIAQAVVDEAAKDLMQNNGPGYVKSKLKDRDVKVPRDTVRLLMHQNFPEGAEKCFPGNRKTQLKRQPLFSLGPFHEVAGDGHEKIGVFALEMGGIGLPIYGYRDKWSGTLLKIDVVPNCRSAGAIGHLYLDLIERLGGIPLQLNLDKGSEIGWEVALQTVLREAFAPLIDPDVFQAVMLLKSIHNIIIESLWRWLREKSGLNLRDIILRGKEKHLIRTDIPYHCHLFYWIFVPLVQAELDDFQLYWNQRHVRNQPGKNMPSDHVPIDAIARPQLFGGIDCLVRVPQEAVDDMRQFLTDEVGSKESFNRFFPLEFEKTAVKIYKQVGSPVLSLTSAWSVFTTMSNTMASTLYA